MINSTALDALLTPAIEATAPFATEHGLTAEQHAAYATEMLMLALAKVDQEDPDLAARVHAALTH